MTDHGIDAERIEELCGDIVRRYVSLQSEMATLRAERDQAWAELRAAHVRLRNLGEPAGSYHEALLAVEREARDRGISVADVVPTLIKEMGELWDMACKMRRERDEALDAVRKRADEILAGEEPRGELAVTLTEAQLEAVRGVLRAADQLHGIGAAWRVWTEAGRPLGGGEHG